MIKKEIIEFECVYGTASFSGYAYKDELDDEEPLTFYGYMNQPQSHLNNAYFEGSEEDQQKLSKAFTGDWRFIQFLADFADESVTIDREDYTLLINGGTQLEMNVTLSDKFVVDDVLLNAEISFNFGDTILCDDLLDELADDIDSTWSGERIYKVGYGLNCIFLEIDGDWWDEEVYAKLYGLENKKAVEKEMLEDAEKIFVRQLVLDKGFYVKYQELLEKYYLENDDRRIFDKDDIRAVADNYEEIMECLNLKELDIQCSKYIEEEIIDFIKRDKN